MMEYQSTDMKRVVEEYLRAGSNVVLCGNCDSSCMVSLVECLSLDNVFIQMDAKGCATEDMFCSEYSRAVMAKVNELLGQDNVGNVEFSSVLSMPQLLADNTDKKVIVWIDNFHLVNEYSDTVAFQRVLRSNWQKHTDVTYCLSGEDSKAMVNLFANPVNPFYMFGALLSV